MRNNKKKQFANRVRKKPTRQVYRKQVLISYATRYRHMTCTLYYIFTFLKKMVHSPGTHNSLSQKKHKINKNTSYIQKKKPKQAHTAITKNILNCTHFLSFFSFLSLSPPTLSLSPSPRSHCHPCFNTCSGC